MEKQLSVSRWQSVLAYFRNPTVDWKPKAAVVAAVLYLIWPADLIPDLPLLGWLDDVGVGSIVLWYVFRAVDRQKNDPPKHEAGGGA